MTNNLDHHFGAWNRDLLNPPRKRIPIASWLVEQGELLGEICYIVGHVFSCVCFVIFVIWDAFFGERHSDHAIQRRIEEERAQGGRSDLDRSADEDEQLGLDWRRRKRESAIREQAHWEEERRFQPTNRDVLERCDEAREDVDNLDDEIRHMELEMRKVATF